MDDVIYECCTSKVRTGHPDRVQRRTQPAPHPTTSVIISRITTTTRALSYHPIDFTSPTTTSISRVRYKDGSLRATGMSSADTQPISAPRFAAALKDLSVGMLHLKVLEIRNSIAHLQYSNDQLRPFANGSETAIPTDGTAASPASPDQDCIDAIEENEQVIDRMAERIALIRAEVEDRGIAWTEFQSKDEADSKQDGARRPDDANGDADPTREPQHQQHSAWTDGTFQTGSIRDGQVHLNNLSGHPVASGGSLSDEQLRRAVHDQIQQLANDDGQDGGMHL
ncbi:hypothetical protein DCS_04757 [Drechmeria coniospora]|uniref:Secondary alcohol dehydrogenase protein n=1 Tax=Drechmeria coniospora TaxID=98403 RepID=A0A151GKW2_DRECN|nr:hypothetical protein DCS_04757 [Drechmeria coniospora]KYK57744.1 hypothetical protein DCS_04757 [Drechmeria coniospora]